MCQAFVIDDEAEIRIALQQSFELEAISARFFDSAELAFKAVSEDAPQAIVTDIRLNGMTGLDLLKDIKASYPDLPVILITGHGDISMAVDAMHQGAYDFIEKPFAPERLTDSVRRAIEKHTLTKENQRLRQSLKASQALGPRIIGETAPIQQLKHTIHQIADTSADVLIFGETGTGKELVARSLHEQSTRKNKNFVALNCGAIPEQLIESELFGHEKGAFTDAKQRRIGKLEHAQGGTLFLDEIESMPMQAQIHLLRVLQERVIERVGSNTLIPIDIRVIAATKVDLLQAAAQGTFREDLYYRLNVVTLNLPPLRERKEDIPALFHHFLLLSASRYGKTSESVSARDLSSLLNHNWPGNVRELRNAAERFVLLGQVSIEGGANATDTGLGLAEQVAAFERYTLEQTLVANQGSIKKTMEVLQLPRKTLYDKMQRYQLDKANYKNQE